MARALLLDWAEEERLARLLSIERRWLRDRSNPLELPEIKFMANFRLTKDAFQHVLEELRPYIPEARPITAVRYELKILAALNFYAVGSYQRGVGLSFLNTVSQPTFSRILSEVTDALNAREILLKYIRFPSCRREREGNMTEFMTKFGFPGIIGCIDGTHVKIIRPVNYEDSFVNRNRYHSLNVLLVSVHSLISNLNISTFNIQVAWKRLPTAIRPPFVFSYLYDFILYSYLFYWCNKKKV